MFYTTINKTEARTMYDTIKMLLPKYDPLMEAFADLTYDKRIKIDCEFLNIDDDPNAKVVWARADCREPYEASFVVPLKLVVGNYTPRLDISDQERYIWSHELLHVVYNDESFDLPAKLVAYYAYMTLIRFGEQIAINELGDPSYEISDTIRMANPHGNGPRRLPEEYLFIAFDRFDEKSGYICQKRQPFHKGYNETTHRKEFS